MTVASTARRSDAVGNGATKTYSYGFRILAADELLVSVQDTAGVINALTRPTDYTVTGVGLYAGGTIVLVNAGQAWLDAGGNLKSSYKLTIRRRLPLTQQTDLRNSGDFYPEDHETQFDRGVMIALQQQDELDRSIKFPETDSPALSAVLPASSQRASKWAAYDSLGQPIASSGSAPATVPVSVYGETLVAAGSAAAARSILEFSQVAPPQAYGAAGLALNLSLSFSVAGNALTMAIKGANGADPSATNPVYIPFRSATAGNGAPVWRTLSAASSLTISSGSTAGHNSGLKQYLYWYVVDNGGVLKPAFSSKFFGMYGIATTVAEGGAGTADSGTVMYSDAAYSNVPFLCIGYTEDTQTTAGTWAAAPSAAHLAPFTLPVISFSAHKNGVSQDGIVSGAMVKITFSTERYDNGGLFDSATNYRWVPPPGTVQINSVIRWAASVDQTRLVIFISKNGVSLIEKGIAASGTGLIAVGLNISDECNGTDFYETFVLQNSGVNQSVDGDATVTNFMGSWSPGRS